MAQPVVGEMEMLSVANLATLQTPLATFFPSKKRPNLVTDTAARGLALPARARTPLSLSLSLSASAQFLSQRVAERSSALIQLNTDIMLLL